MEEQPPQAVILNQGTSSNRDIGNASASHLCGSLLNLIFPYFCWVVPLILYSTNNSEDTRILFLFMSIILRIVLQHEL